MNPEPITGGQQVALRRLIDAEHDTKRLWIISQLVGRAIPSFDDLTLQDWRSIRNRAYPDWKRDDWTVGETFQMELAHLRSRYAEEVSGQMRLF